VWSYVVGARLISSGLLATEVRRGLQRKPKLGTLDAIHVVTAFEHRPIDAFVTYDQRQAKAARRLGLPTVSPGMKR
jgi:predicted nucleic acid-binding protein